MDSTRLPESRTGRTMGEERTKEGLISPRFAVCLGHGSRGKMMAPFETLYTEQSCCLVKFLERTMMTGMGG